MRTAPTYFVTGRYMGEDERGIRPRVKQGNQRRSAEIVFILGLETEPVSTCTNSWVCILLFVVQRKT